IFRARKHLAQSLTDSVKKGSRAVASIFNLRWLFNAFKGLGGGLGGAGLAGGTAAVIIAVGGGVAIDLATQSASASHVHRAASSKTAVAVSADRRAAVTPAGATSGTRVPASGPVSARKLGSPSAVRGSGGSGASKSASSATGSNGSAGAAGASNGASGSSSPRAGSGSRSGAGGPPVRPSKPRSKGGRPFATKPPPLPAPPVVPSLPPLGTPPVPPVSVPPLAPPTLPPPPVSTPPVPLPSPPTITVPGNLVAEATGPLGAAVSYTVTATDAADGTDPVACSAASGSTFRLGHTTVSCSATDKAGSTSTASFDVLVHDTTPPSLSVPSGITVKASLAGGVKVTYTATATDLVDPAPTVSCSPASGSLFLVGTTTVTCTATDSAGNSSSKKFTVTVTL
ncbi:MAG TPA: HYR domain-containing protein, partial [Gaiellaceae bacterium]|nr:HYR domain-containing protein [Gaiellaceae bacterium]